MPFVTPARRKYLDGGGEPIELGDMCYNFYKPMVEAWKANPRWATAPDIYKRMVEEFDFLSNEDDRVAYRLAWEVFFALHVLEYEKRKREENGDI